MRALLAAGVGAVVGITTTSSAADLLAAGAHRTVADLGDPWLVAARRAAGPRPRRPSRACGAAARIAAMAYRAADDRYDSMTYRRTGRSGLDLPGDQPGAVAQLRRRRALRPAAGDPAARLRPRRHPLRPGQQLRPALRLRGDQLRPAPRRRLRPVPRRAGHLHQGRLRHVARPVRAGRRRPEVRAGQPRPVAARGWAWTTSTSSTPTGPTRRRRSRRRWARCTPPSGAARPSTPASPPTRRRTPRRPPRSSPTSGRRC